MDRWTVARFTQETERFDHFSSDVALIDFVSVNKLLLEIRRAIEVESPLVKELVLSGPAFVVNDEV